MKKPIVAIVGRPNVGKSTLFNQLAGQRLAIVGDTPGVTRDRLYADAEWLGRVFTIIDTGGIELKNDNSLLNSMRAQAELAMEAADVIIFVLDARAGATGEDAAVADMLRRYNKPIVMAVNKVDRPEDEQLVWDFYNLGMDAPMVTISSSHKKGIGDLLDLVTEGFPSNEEEIAEENVIRIAVVGKPNAGKSSLVNRLLGEERVIVSDMAGTTRDAIDTELTVNGQKYVLIDTAGIRRKSRVEEDLEYYSVLRALSAIRRCDVAIIMIDAGEEATEQDTKIAGLVLEEGKAAIFAVNKWDTVDKDNDTIYDYEKKVADKFSFMDYAPIMFISALTGQRLGKLFPMVKEVYEKYSKRVTTGVLNDWLNEATAITPPPAKNGRRLKIYYASQVSVKPPTFVFFVNDMSLAHYSYQRYLENSLRKAFMLDGTPLKLIFRNRENKDK